MRSKNEIVSEYKKVMRLIEELVANVNTFVPKMVADKREALEKELIDNGYATYDERYAELTIL